MLVYSKGSLPYVAFGVISSMIIKSHNQILQATQHVKVAMQNKSPQLQGLQQT